MNSSLATALKFSKDSTTDLNLHTFGIHSTQELSLFLKTATAPFVSLTCRDYQRTRRDPSGLFLLQFELVEGEVTHVERLETRPVIELRPWLAWHDPVDGAAVPPLEGVQEVASSQSRNRHHHLHHVIAVESVGWYL